MITGIIGGSGLYEIDGLAGVVRRKIKTPFGAPSDSYVCGKIQGDEVVFLPRHGRGHRIMPGEINHRANIIGFKMLGVNRIVSVSAVGSLKEEYRPGDIVLPDQYFDRTHNVNQTFFGDGIVAHVSFANPTCDELRGAIVESIGDVLGRKSGNRKVRVHEGGTYVNIEGPAFSTRSESLSYRKSGFDVIGMTGLPEAKLCREAGICFQPIAMITDYDCWRETEEEVSVEMVLGRLVRNTILAKRIIMKLIPRLARRKRACACGDALKNAIVTSRDAIPRKTAKKLRLIAGEYL